MTRTTRRRLVVVALLVVSVGTAPVVSGLAAGQAAPPAGPGAGAGTDDGATERGDDNTTAGAGAAADESDGGGPSQPNAGGDGGGGGFGASFDIPDPWETAKSALVGAYEDTRDGLVELGMDVIALFNGAVLTAPAPGEPDDATTWIVFDDSLWGGVWSFYAALMGLVILALGTLAVVTATRSNVHERRQRIRRLFKAAALIITGPILLPLALHAANAFALGFAPSGEELFTAPGGLERLAVGVVVGIIIAATKLTVVLVAAVALLAQWFFVLFLVAVWPLAVIATISGSDHIARLGHTAMGTLIFLILLKPLQALLLRFLFELPLGGSPEGALGMLVQALGLGLVFIVLPIWGLKDATPHAVTAIGGAAPTGGATSAQLRERAPSREQVTERVQQFRRGRGEDGRGRATPSPGSGAYRGSRSRPGTGSDPSSAGSSAALSEDWRHLRRSSFRDGARSDGGVDRSRSRHTSRFRETRSRERPTRTNETE